MPVNASSDASSTATPRKNPTYGGSRAWSEEEETFLLESRQRKTPYKHIATYLQKTELACRLHYHQLAYGTKRKRRCTSASSNSTGFGEGNASTAGARRGHSPQKSVDSTTSHLSPQPPNLALRSTSPPTSPRMPPVKRLVRSESPPVEHQLTIPNIGAGPATANIPSREQFSPFGRPSHLEYAPDFMPNHHRISLPAQTPFAVGRNAGLLNMSADSALSTGILQIGAHPGADPANLHERADCYIDPVRLDGCYRRHRHTFWASVARDYGTSMDPLVLEAAFLRRHAASPISSLPTPPNRSPVLLPVVMTEDVESGKVTMDAAHDMIEHNSIKPSGGTCSIANILTEDQEVWSRRRRTV